MSTPTLASQSHGTAVAEPEDLADLLALNQQVAQALQSGRLDQGLEMARQACERLRERVGEEHPLYAVALGNLGEAQRLRGDYEPARPHYLEALKILERVPDGGSDEAQALAYASRILRANILNNLGSLDRDMGHYAEALEKTRRALTLRVQVLGDNHPDIAQSLNNLSLLFHLTGDLRRAEGLGREAVQLFRATAGESDPRYADALNNLAEIYESMGDPALARQLLEAALDIRRTVLGERNPRVAQSLSNLAEACRRTGDLAAAERYADQALAAWSAAYGGGRHPDIATSLNNRAVLACAAGRCSEAEPWMREACEMRRALFGDRHPHVAQILANLAELRRMAGDPQGGEPLAREALKIRREVLGEEHPDTAHSLGVLARIRAAQGDPAEALDLLRQAGTVDDHVLDQVFALGSERQRMACVKSVRATGEMLLSLVATRLASDPWAVSAALDVVLRRKGLGAEGVALQRDAVLAARHPELAAKLRSLAELRMEIARRTLAGPGEEGLEAHRRRLAELKARREPLEFELAHEIPEASLEQRLRRADVASVASALPPDAALVEIVRFAPFDFAAGWKPARYLGFVLTGGEDGRLGMEDLGEAASIEEKLAAYGTALVRGEGRSAVARQAGEALRAAVFDPLRPLLGERTRLFLAPDGPLALVPFEVLPTGEDRYLTDDVRISYLDTGRDLLRWTEPPAGAWTRPLVAAAPDFNLHGQRPDEDGGETGWRASRDLRGGPSFQPLPGTRVEGEEVARLLGARPLLGAEVLERTLKEAHSPRIVHLATHGFFLPDQPRATDPEDLLVRETFGRLASALESPLLRSGLALAGANTWLRGEAPPAAAEDGILTAEDVSGMDLLDTDLVVLSACKTGVGEVQAGEGVLGLRRAFTLAGARTLVVSLWKVRDGLTRTLMGRFYELLRAGVPRADALREACLEVRDLDSDPRSWGAFICLGDPGPLDPAPAPA